MSHLIASLVLVFALALAEPAPAQGGPPQGFKCNECHSKDPKLLSMHKALEYKNCGLCHKGAVRSISAMRMTRQEKHNRAFDPRCKPCHAK